MFSIVKPFLIACAIIIILLFLIGIIRIERADYGCFRGKTLRFDERVKLLDVGSFKMYGYPLMYDCPEEDQYNPDTVYKCSDNTYCQKDSDETEKIR